MFLPEPQNFYHAKQNIFFGHDKICIPPLPPKKVFLLTTTGVILFIFRPLQVMIFL
jgi:hypothetical protein